MLGSTALLSGLMLLKAAQASFIIPWIFCGSFKKVGLSADAGFFAFALTWTFSRLIWSSNEMGFYCLHANVGY